MKVAVIAATSLLAVLTTTSLAVEPKAFVCKFTEGNSAKYEAGWSMKILNEKMDFTFGSLDPQQGKAQLIGNVGASGVRFWKGTWTWNFVEVTDVGNINTTTVYEALDGKDYPAVHSRHPSLAGLAFPSQYRGVCSARS